MKEGKEILTSPLNNTVIIIIWFIMFLYRCTASRYGLDKVAEKLKEHGISGLLIIGGFEVKNMKEEKRQIIHP